MNTQIGSARMLNSVNANALGWHHFAYGGDIDASYELMAADAYAQLAVSDLIEAVSSAAGDTTQILTVWGIDTDNNRVSSPISLNGATAVKSSITWKYIEGARLNVACAGTVTIRRDTGDTAIATITIGELSTSICQHFTGENASFITQFDAGITSVTSAGLYQVELRWYPEAISCLGTSTGHEVLACIEGIIKKETAEYSWGRDMQQNFNPAIYCPPGGWIAVMAKATTANSTMWGRIAGFDTSC